MKRVQEKEERLKKIFEKFSKKSKSTFIYLFSEKVQIFQFLKFKIQIFCSDIKMKIYIWSLESGPDQFWPYLTWT